MWNYCPTKENPADLPSRGITYDEYATSALWHHGPSWITEPKEKWPIQPTDLTPKVPTNMEENQKITALTANVTQPLRSIQILNTEKFSKYIKIMRITAWVRRFISNLKKKRERLDIDTTEITYREIKEAELHWFSLKQKEHFEEEYNLLKKQQEITAQSSLYKLKPYLDKQGIIRIGGRLEYANLPEDFKHPIILPKHDDLVDKLILFTHQLLLCSGPEQTLATLRRTVWIPQARQAIRRSIKQCGICRRYRAQPCQPVMAALPRFRTDLYTPPFHTVGLDLAGPFNIDTIEGPKKAYIALFTCAVIRAVHLELLTNMDTNQILMAIKRFTGRRGPVSVIWSDNAKYFKAADKYITRLWRTIDHKKIQQKLVTEKIEWKYIPELSPHFGGFYERLFRSIKSPLRKAIGNVLLTYEEFYTVLVNIEQILNSRPLTHHSEDPDSINVLTPAHFLIGRPLIDLPDDRQLVTQANHILRYKERQKIIQHFWKRFYREYLPKLIPYTKWLENKDHNLGKEDVVLLYEPNQPRSVWPVGRVIQTFPGKDGIVRVAEVKTPAGLFRRSVGKLYLMEASSHHGCDGGRGEQIPLPELVSATPKAENNEQTPHGGRHTKNSTMGRQQ
jgi:hypothetical protein